MNLFLIKYFLKIYDRFNVAAVGFPLPKGLTSSSSYHNMFPKENNNTHYGGLFTFLTGIIFVKLYTNNSSYDAFFLGRNSNDGNFKLNSRLFDQVLNTPPKSDNDKVSIILVF